MKNKNKKETKKKGIINVDMNCFQGIFVIQKTCRGEDIINVGMGHHVSFCGTLAFWG